MNSEKRWIIITLSAIGLAVAGLLVYYLVAPDTTTAPASETGTPKEEREIPDTVIEVPEAEPKQQKEEELLKDYYTQFAAKDKAKLFSLFTAPATENERLLYGLLLNGKNPDGTPGGPTLFESSSASGVVQAYEITAKTGTEAGILFTVKETVDYPEKSGVERTRYIETITLDSGVLIRQYYSGEPAKYSGFLN